MASVPLSVLIPDPNEPLRMAQGLTGIQGQQQAIALNKALAPGQIQEQQQALQEGLQNKTLRDQAITEGQQRIAARQALNQAYAGAVTKDANGVPTFDRDKISSALAQSNQGAEIPEVMKGLQAMDQQAATIQDLKDKHTTTATDYMGAAAKTVKDSGYDQNVIGLVLQHASQAGFSQEAQQVAQAIQQNPKAVQPIFDHLLAQSTAQQKLATEQEQADAAKLRAQNTSPSDAGLALRASQGDPQAIAALKTIHDQAVKKSGDEANARLQVENSPAAIQGAVNKAAAVQKALNSGSDAALANVPPHLVAQATTQATKAGEEYAQAQSVTDRLKAMMEDARKGNVVSYQLLPQEGALQLTTSQGVKRINMAEIQNYGGGSLWQRMEGHIGKQLTGKSIPASVLDDMAEMQKIQADGAKTKYENSLKTINQNTGSTFKPVEMDEMKSSTQQFKVPAGAPSARGLSDGHKLKDSSGNVVAISKGGEWATPTQ